jgi:GNAT superfamily N-acetyltransferase
LYFLINGHDKQRFYSAIKGQSYEKVPIFRLRRKGRLGTIDAFWQENMAQLLAGAIQFAVLPNQLILTHMAVRTNWRKQGINSRLVDYLKQRYPRRQIVYDSPTKMGQGFIDSYER